MPWVVLAWRWQRAVTQTVQRRSLDVVARSNSNGFGNSRTPPSGRTTFARSTRREERGPEKSSSSPLTRKSSLSLLPSPRGETALPTDAVTTSVATVSESRKCASASEHREFVDDDMRPP